VVENRIVTPNPVSLTHFNGGVVCCIVLAT
jgi:hypothetical protein